MAEEEFPCLHSVSLLPYYHKIYSEQRNQSHCSFNDMTAFNAFLFYNRCPILVLTGSGYKHPLFLL